MKAPNCVPLNFVFVAGIQNATFSLPWATRIRTAQHLILLSLNFKVSNLTPYYFDVQSFTWESFQSQRKVATDVYKCKADTLDTESIHPDSILCSFLLVKQVMMLC